jgi:hypothetical protein
MTHRRTIVAAILVVLLGFEVLVLAILAYFPYISDPGLASLNADLYTLLAPLSTILLVGLLYAWLIKLVLRQSRQHSPRFNRFIRFLSEPFKKQISSIKTRSVSETSGNLKVLSHPRLLLAISLAASALLALIPYRPDLNPTGDLVGIDSPLYVGWIGQMLARPLSQALQYSFVEGLEGSRPLLLILLYLVASIGASPSQILEYLPMLLAPLLSLSTYFFVRYGQRNTAVAALAALFSSISFYTPVALWSGYYANWLALVFAYLYMTILLVYSRTSSSLNYLTLSILSIALFLAHPWTWVLIATVSLVFAASLWRETHNPGLLRSIITIILSGIVIDLLKSLIFSTRTVAADIATKTPGAGFLLGFWSSLVQALLYTHAGLLGNWLVFALAVLAVFALRFRDHFERLLILWTSVASVPFAVLDSYHQARIVYDLPIPVLMAETVLFFLPLLGNGLLRRPGLLISLIVIILADYSIQGILLI